MMLMRDGVEGLMNIFEPMLVIEQALLPNLETLKALEPLIYAANAGASRAHFEHLLAPEFWEVGASGKRYSRTFVLNTLEQRQQNPVEEVWHATDYHLQRIVEQHFLLTYTLHQPTRISQRASLWWQTEMGWKLLYHQGTVVQG
jgi:hypothetical protein